MTLTPTFWSDEFRVSPVEEDVGASRIGSLADGGFIVGWDDRVDPADPNSAIVTRFQRCDGAGNLVGGVYDEGQGPYVLAENETDLNDGNRVAIGPGGGVSYRITITAPDGSVVRQFSMQVDVREGYFIFGRDVFPLSNGGFAVAYQHGSLSQVMLRMFDAQGNEVSGDISVGASYKNRVAEPRGELLENGNFVVTYTSSGPDSSVPYTVYCRVFDAAGNPVSSLITVPTTPIGDDVDITPLNDGGFFIIWSRGDNELRGQRFDASGQKVGEELLIHGESPAFYTECSVTTDGRIVVTWTDQNADIQARILDPRNPGILGTAGDDVIYGRIDGSTIQGLAGDDTLVGMQASDRLIGGEGHDDLSGGDGDDRIIGGNGTDVLRGGSGADTLEGDAGNDILLAGSGNDAAYGGDGDDTIRAGAGDDILFGGADSDVLEGNAGNDIFIIDALDTVVEEANQGIDQVRVFGFDYTLGDNVEILRIRGGAVNGTGNALDNSLYGSSNDNTLSGLAGDDLLDGKGGLDTLVGGDGNDILVGGAGRDTLTGGAGADRFTWRDVAEGNASATFADTITDFNHAEGDVINLSAIDAILGGGTSNDSFTFIGKSAFHGTAGELRFKFDGTGDTLVQMDINGDRVTDLTIRLTGEIELTAADFLG